MSKVLFTHSYFYRFDSKQWKFAQPYPPLGTISAAAFLRENGHEVFLHDSNLETTPKNILPKLDSIKPEYLVIYDDGFNYLTKMCLTTMREAAFEMIQYGKDRGMTVILNSSDSTDHYEEYLEKGADFIIHGEGEHALLELVETINAGEDAKLLKGISYLLEGAAKKTPPRVVLKDLDVLPQAAWDLIDVEPYREIWENKHGFFSLNLATTRGCPYKCNWCAKPIYGNRYNTRSPKRVIDEIEHLINTFDVNYFWMCDDIFGLKPNWVQEFSRLKKERGLEFRYKIQSRVDLMLKEDNLDALAESGADMIWVGAESGSQKILDAMDKGTQVEQIYEATRKLKERNVKVAFFLQFGYIDETIKDIQKTIAMVMELMPDDIGISVSYPLPGTKFYEKVKDDLALKANWTDSDDLDMMFQNTYPPVFYKTLHRYVHNRYRVKNGSLSIKEMLSRPFGNVKKNGMNIIKMVYHLPQVYYNNRLLKKYSSVKV